LKRAIDFGVTFVVSWQHLETFKGIKLFWRHAEGPRHSSDSSHVQGTACRQLFDRQNVFLFAGHIVKTCEQCSETK